MKTITLHLDGGELVLGPLLVATIRDNKEAIAKAHRNELAPAEFIDLTCTLVVACARRVDASVTLGQVEQLIDMANLQQVFAACWGVTVPEPLPGEALQAASPST